MDFQEFLPATDIRKSDSRTLIFEFYKFPSSILQDVVFDIRSYRIRIVDCIYKKQRHT